MRQITFAITVILLFSPFQVHADSLEEDVNWCLNGDATYHIWQQPMRDYCPWVAAGDAVGVWYGQAWAYLVASQTQKEWSRAAADMACSGDSEEMAAAVGLLAACQCHNKGAADRIVGHPDQVLAILMNYAGCAPQMGADGESDQSSQSPSAPAISPISPSGGGIPQFVRPLRSYTKPDGSQCTDNLMSDGTTISSCFR